MQEIVDSDRAAKEVVNERIAITRALAVGHLSEAVHCNSVVERKGEIQRKKNLTGGPNVVIIQRWSSCHSGYPSLYNSAEQMQTGPSNHLTPAFMRKFLNTIIRSIS